MIKLIRKEIMFMRGWLVVVFAFPILTVYIIFLEKSETYIFLSLLICVTTIMSILSIMGQERTTKLDSFMLSLPINRNDIVKSKYVVYGLLPVIYSTSLYFSLTITSHVFKLEDINIGIDFILLAGSISLITVAIVMPILFKGNRKYKTGYRIINFLYLAIILFGTSISSYLDILVLNLNFELLGIVLSVIAIVVYLISHKVSQKLYGKMLS